MLVKQGREVRKLLKHNLLEARVATHQNNCAWVSMTREVNHWARAYASAKKNDVLFSYALKVGKDEVVDTLCVFPELGTGAANLLGFVQIRPCCCLLISSVTWVFRS